MPGPVSDSYDREFGTGANAHEVCEAMRAVVELLGPHLGDRRYILDVAREENGPPMNVSLSERQWRLVRFGLEYALDCI